jgi:hypothetical protein
VKFVNTTKQQKSYIDTAKDITTNTDTQKTLITANMKDVRISNGGDSRLLR